MNSVTTVAVTTVEVHRLAISDDAKYVVIGLCASMTQPVHGPIVLALLEIFEDGVIRREVLAHDVCAVGWLAKLSDGDGTVRDDPGVNKLSALSGGDECEVEADAGKGEDKGFAPNECAAPESERVTMTGEGAADCAFTILCCELDDEIAANVALSAFVSHGCEHA
jgi:hypothetical protein